MGDEPKNNEAADAPSDAPSADAESTPTPDDTSTPDVTPTPEDTGKAAGGKSKKKMMIVVAAVLLVLVGGLYFVYAALISAPEARLALAIGNLRDADSVTVSSDTTFGSGEEALNTDFSLSYVKSPFNFSANLGVDFIITEVTSDVIYADGNYYVRVGGLEGVDALLGPLLAGGVTGDSDLDALIGPLAIGLIDTLNEQWIEVSGALLQSVGFDTESVVSTIQANLDAVDDPRDGYTLVEEFPDEIVDGVTANHFSVTVEGEGMAELIADIFGGVTIGDTIYTREAVIASFNEAESEAGVSGSEGVIEVWIDPSNDHLLRIQIDVGEDGESMPVALNFTSYDSVTPAVAPDGAITVLELLSVVTESLTDLGLSETEAGALLDLSSLGLE